MAEQPAETRPARESARAFSTAREKLVRGVVLAYVLVLWMAVWPFEQAPLLGDARRGAEKLLGRASLYAGMAVFSAQTSSGNLPWVDCTVVLAHSRGKWKRVYGPECPRKGTLFLENSFDETVSRMMRKAKLFRLAQAERPTARAMRNVLQVNDYFCHAQPELEIDRVRLHWSRVMRNYQTGEFLESEAKVVCVSQCDASGKQLPICTLRAPSGQDP